MTAPTTTSAGNTCPANLAEFDFRYSTRDLDDTDRMARLMGRVGGKRLAYKPRTAE